ncbi:MAG: CehA/McbA family metallohydrolase [Pirellulales bacterium]|nr:CehA/McbA family metallohydrolase [Pirellulales bacterium]
MQSYPLPLNPFPLGRFLLIPLGIACLAICCLVGSPAAEESPPADQAAPATLPTQPMSAATLEFLPVEAQPFFAATERLIQALDYVGAPLSAADAAAIATAIKTANEQSATAAEPQKSQILRAAARQVQAVLDKSTLVAVTINPESRVSVAAGPARRELVQQGWRTFLVKVHNQPRITPQLRIDSPNAQPLYQQGSGGRERPQTTDKLVAPADVPGRFLSLEQFTKQPLRAELSGLECEYRILQLYSRDVGRREATLQFDVGQGTQDLGFRNELPVLFEAVPACEVVLTVQDHDGTPTTAAFVVRDAWGRVYPNPARRLAPDFFFHEQIYRADGESLHLPPGEYSVTVGRGPEYHTQTKKVSVPAAVSHREVFRLNRWIHPKTRGWFSGDHHVHAAGCGHYDSPTEGVGPADMLRHIVGEDLNVGCVLSWGPCWYTQKQYFEGKTSALSRPNYLMRYDVEVSGFPSSHAGHLCLLRLKEDDYPGTTEIEQWPSWTQPVLAWGKGQGGVVGYSHSGWGLALPDIMPNGERKFGGQPWGGAPAGWQGRAADTLPDYAMPPFDGIGANEFIVTLPNGQCDFLSAVDTPIVWELNIWYHTLNCGLRGRISGETDFPCIYGDKVGLGRIYVKLPTDQPLDFDAWCEGVKAGRSYCGDGLSHLLDFRVNDVSVGEPGSGGKLSQLDLPQPGKVTVTCDAAALLAAEPTEATERIRAARLDNKPYWHIERARVEKTRQVPVEVIVNGRPVAKHLLTADGTTQSLKFDVELTESSWVAVRIFPSCHTNPVFVEVAGQPIRADAKSAQWCRDAVDVCWRAKQGQIRESERPAARAAYDQARAYYEKVLAEVK